MKYAKSLFICLICFFSVIGISQEFPVLTGPYLGQNPPGKTPEIFAPGIISTDRIDWGITFSPDGRECFFGRRDNTDNIMMTREVNGRWSRPQIAPFSSKYQDIYPDITPDGFVVYFGTYRPFSEHGGSNGLHQWFSKKTNSGWSKAFPMEPPLTEVHMMRSSVANSGNMYFTYQNGDNQFVYMTKYIDGRYIEPEKLDQSINSLSYVGHPFIDPDEEYIIVDAFMGRQEDKVNRDLFISFKNSAGNWTKAIKFGREINTNDNELCSFVSRDGKYLFFIRENDIYWVNANIIEDLKPDELK